jgi:hypothetical protein
MEEIFIVVNGHDESAARTSVHNTIREHKSISSKSAFGQLEGACRFYKTGPFAVLLRE